MGVQSKASHSEESLTIHEIVHPPIPMNLEDNPDVSDIHEDFKKLDCPKSSEEPRSYSPDDLLNYNDGLPANPFNKLAKVYGRHKDVFLFVAVVFSPEQHEKFMSVIREKYEDDLKSVERFMRKMKTYKNRISKGNEDAKQFLPEELKDCPAFFNGYHVDQLPAHQRNIHENLNINVVAAGKKLETSQLFNRKIPGEEQGSSELRRLKIYANGQRAMTVFKGDGGIRSYTPTKAAEMDLEIKWVARDPRSKEEIKCWVVLGFKNGRVTVKKGGVEGDAWLQTNLTILELAKQNESVLIRKKSLFQLLEKKAENLRKRECTERKASSGNSREKLVPLGLPKQLETVKDKMDSVSKLIFAEGPCSNPKDELNYNEGKAANPFDKLAKVEGRQKDVFLFNKVLRDPQEFEMMMSIVNEKCGEDNPKLKKAFLKRKEIYLKRVTQGEQDAGEITGKDFDSDWIEAFTHGYHVAKEGHPRNIHSNLNVNLTNAAGKALETSEYLQKVTPKMEEEKSQVERVKIYGNGRRLVNVTKNGMDQRKYSFSRLAEMEMEVEWVAKKKNGEGKKMELMCSLVLIVKHGQISVKQATIDQVPVDLGQMLELAKQNREILIGNKDLAKVLRELIQTDQIAVGFMNEELQGKPTGWKWANSKEKLTIREFFAKKNVADEDVVKSLLKDVSNLDFTNELCHDPKDVLNYNEGLKANQFCKLRKYWGRHKSLPLFLSVCADPHQREKILEVVAFHCGENVEAKENFSKRLNIFLDRMKGAEEDAKEFLKPVLKDITMQEIRAVFGGHHVPHQEQARNIHANLNVNLENSKPDMTLFLPDIFLQRIPRMDKEKSQLNRIKLFGNGKRIATILKNDQGQRKYAFSELADMDFGIEWEFKKQDDQAEQKAELLLNVKNGVVTILQAKVDGEVVSSSEILEVAGKNQEILFRKKGLREFLHESLSKTEAMPHSSGADAAAPVSSGVKNADDEFVVIEEDGDGDGSSSDDMFGQW